ncbi:MULTISPECIES: hypothetical protein [unclassified Microcoleus]|nr:MULTISPECIES: hypothetical protein [unclassified Microcoleus]
MISSCRGDRQIDFISMRDRSEDRAVETARKSNIHSATWVEE